MSPGVDQAMAAERHDKKTIRHLWVETAGQVVAQHAAERLPLYVTLSGADGRDIDALLAAGVIPKTEVGSIREDFANRVIAIESRPEAQLELRRRFAGIRIIADDVGNVVHGLSDIKFPTGPDLEACKGRIINLDLNRPLLAREEDGVRVFPVIVWVKKLAAIHRSPRRVTDWHLFLTLHGEIVLDTATCATLCDFLAENCEHQTGFQEDLASALGEPLVGRITQRTDGALEGLPAEAQQKLLLFVVPKLLAHEVHTDGWELLVTHSLHYGGHGTTAPMTTWLINFRLRQGSTSRIYAASLRAIRAGLGRITAAGVLEPYG